jgi:hypothetical protein
MRDLGDHQPSAEATDDPGHPFYWARSCTSERREARPGIRRRSVSADLADQAGFDPAAVPVGGTRCRSLPAALTIRAAEARSES